MLFTLLLHYICTVLDMLNNIQLNSSVSYCGVINCLWEPCNLVCISVSFLLQYMLVSRIREFEVA